MSAKTFQERVQLLSKQQLKLLVKQLTEAAENKISDTESQQLVAYVTGSKP